MDLSLFMQHFGIGPIFLNAAPLGADFVGQVEEAESLEQLPVVFGDRWKQLEYTLSTNRRGRRLVERIDRALGGRLPKSGHALDIGCGYGGTLVGFHEYGLAPTGIDLDARLTTVSQKNVLDQGCTATVTTVDAFNHLDASERYELIVMNDVLEHLHDPERAIAMAARALNSGGVLAIYAPNGKHPAYATKDPHNGVFGASALPRSLAMPLVKAALNATDYGLGEYPSLSWLRAQFAQRGLAVTVDPTDYGETIASMPKLMASFFAAWETTPQLAAVADPILRREITQALFDYAAELTSAARQALIEGEEAEFLVRYLRRAWLVLGVKH